MRIIEDFGLGFCLGNVIKYVLRHVQKAGLEDLKKARWYLDREITRQEAEAKRALRIEIASLKHGPGGSGLRGPCDPSCRKCEIERVLEEPEIK